VNASDAAALRRRWLLGIAAACILGVAAAIVAQYRFDMRPCPWCILQRFIYVVIAAVAFVGALTRPLQRRASARRSTRTSSPRGSSRAT
jgi:disulfide bond formation protein DsbB